MATSLGQNQPFRYRGYVYDAETGWYYLQSRYYNPEVGRFISSDVLLSTGQGVLGHNSYAYCLNNPVNMSDPSGCVCIVNSFTKDEHAKSNSEISRSGFETVYLAVCAAQEEYIDDLNHEIEYFTFVYKVVGDDGTVTYSYFDWRTDGSSDTVAPYDSYLMSNYHVVAIIHTHPDGSLAEFSREDIKSFNKQRKNSRGTLTEMFLITTNECKLYYQIGGGGGLNKRMFK